MLKIMEDAYEIMLSETKDNILLVYFFIFHIYNSF